MPDLDQFDVTWNSPSRDASGSMPIGNGDGGANVWVEPSGDLVLLLSKTDAWDEHAINLKLARVRIAMTPNPLASAGAQFSQRLNIMTATIEVNMVTATQSVMLRIWADANHPVIHFDAHSSIPIAIDCRLEMWRTQPRQIKTQTGDLFKNLDGPDPHPTIIQPDTLLPAEDGCITWCHHNRRLSHDAYEVSMRLQGLGDVIDQRPHPLLTRTFGGAIEGNNCIPLEDMRLTSDQASQSHHLRVHLLTLHPSSIETWRARLAEQVKAVRATPVAAMRAAHEGWWRAFWQRSWMVVSGEGAHAEDAIGITRAWLLQRFMNASAGRGASPIKHNGSLFSVGKPDDPDYRRWGGPGYWFMNQRLIYWPMIASGDIDLIIPWIRMYHDVLSVQAHRTHKYFEHDGAHFPETITFWGAEISAHYGWTPFEQRATPEAECPYVRYYWSGGIELSFIIWTIWQHSQDEAVVAEILLPIADAVTTFYDLHYPRDAAGRIRFAPAQALETWHEALNPLPEIAGLEALLSRLLELPADLTTAAQRARWERMLAELPPMPKGSVDGKTVLLPAEAFDRNKNRENPELYAIFPYQHYGVGKPDLDVARDTFAARRNAAHTCWSQDHIQMAMLGMADALRAGLADRAGPASHSDSRFPAFWNAFSDWVPDIDHGGVLQMALQLALMQCDGRRILLLPAWPREWSVTFRLHAPFQTVVEGRVENGQVIDLQVTPASRRSDVQICTDRATSALR